MSTTGPQDPYSQQPPSDGGYGSTPPGGGYGAPPPPPPLPYGQGGAAGAPPNNYLVWAILTTVLCCLPLGIASIVFSTQVNSKWAMGDYAGAQESSEKAKKFAIWAAIVGVIVGIIAVIGQFTFLASLGTLDSVY